MRSHLAGVCASGPGGVAEAEHELAQGRAERRHMSGAAGAATNVGFLDELTLALPGEALDDGWIEHAIMVASH